jgi:hypothetical protein
MSLTRTDDNSAGPVTPVASRSGDASAKPKRTPSANPPRQGFRLDVTTSAAVTDDAHQELTEAIVQFS